MIERIRWWLAIASITVLPMVSVLNISTRSHEAPPITDLAFSPDGKSLVHCSQKGLQIFSWPELSLQKSVSVSFANLQCFKFSPDGKQLAVGGGNPSEEGIVEVFSWPECRSQMELSNHDDSVLSIVWRNNRYLVSAGLDRLVTEWDVETKKPIKTYRGHSRGVSAACILNNGEMVTAGHDQSVRVWDSLSGELIRSLNQHTKSVHAMAVCPNPSGKPMVATAAGDRTIRFWQPTIGRMMRYVRLKSEPLDIAWINDSRLAASCADGQVRIVDTDNVQILETLPGIQGWAYAVAIHPTDGAIAVAGSKGQMRRLEIQASK